MGLSSSTFVFDCADPRRLAAFWAAALGYEECEGGARLRDPSGSGPDFFFQEVPEPKVVKNRLHPDLVADDAAAEVARLEGLGARLLQIHAEGDLRWTVMADPEGNEFCVFPAPGHRGTPALQLLDQ